MVDRLLGEGVRPGTGQSEASALPVTPGMIGIICFHRAQARVSQHPPSFCVQRSAVLLLGHCSCMREHYLLKDFLIGIPEELPTRKPG